MPDIKYVSTVHIHRIAGPLRRATIPVERDPIYFGVHGAIAEHYGVAKDIREPHATTLDYVVAAAGG